MMLLQESCQSNSPWVWLRAATHNTNQKFLLQFLNMKQLSIKILLMLFMNQWFCSRMKMSSQSKHLNSSTSFLSVRKSSTSTTSLNTNSSSTTTTSVCNQEDGLVVGKDSKATHSGKDKTRKTQTHHPSWTV